MRRVNQAIVQTQPALLAYCLVCRIVVAHPAYVLEVAVLTPIVVRPAREPSRRIVTDIIVVPVAENLVGAVLERRHAAQLMARPVPVDVVPAIPLQTQQVTPVEQAPVFQPPLIVAKRQSAFMAMVMGIKFICIVRLAYISCQG
jgi:hypothetical protein